MIDTSTQKQWMKLKQKCPDLLVLTLVILQGGQVGEVALKSLNALLVLSLQLGLFLTLLLQVVDVFVSTADLHKEATAVSRIICTRRNK